MGNTIACNRCGEQFEQVSFGRPRKRCFTCSPSQYTGGYPKTRKPRAKAARQPRTCILCRGEFVPRNYKQRFCSDLCKQITTHAERRIERGPHKTPNARRCWEKQRARLQQSRPGLDTKQRIALLQQWRSTNTQCAYCTDLATAVDHIIPVTRGGTNERTNLAPTCTSCNSRKGTLLPDEWTRKQADDRASALKLLGH